jgi:O-6-methylguanine DNA methyltransferase
MNSALTKIIKTPMGMLSAAATPKGICRLDFTDSKANRAAAAAVPKVRRSGDTAALADKLDQKAEQQAKKHLAQAERELAQYFKGNLRAFKVPLVYEGTPFQVAVWKRLLKIPYGKTASYEEVAADIGRAGAQRAVGTANGKNQIAIVIPCHRVINKSGALGGYGGGLSRKRRLLDLERRAPASSR